MPPAEPEDHRPPPAEARRPVRLPGLVLDEDVGLGTALKGVTAAFGVRPCGGCDRRAAALDRWFVFTARRPG
jgi:hypothetical protein